MKNLTKMVFLVLAVSPLMSCSVEGRCSGATVTAACRSKESHIRAKEARARIGTSSDKDAQKEKGDKESGEASSVTPGNGLIGQSLLSYPDLESVEDDFETAMFEANRDLSDGLVLPIYEISTDDDAVDKLVMVLKQNRSAIVGEESNGIEESYTIEDVYVKVNKETGRVHYVDLVKDHQGPDVEKLDKRLMIEKAEEVFKHYIPEDLLKNTYFYRYAEYTNSAVVRDGDVVTKPYAAAVALNPVVNNLPVIGSGGKYSVHIESDGTVSSFDLQLSRFTPTDKNVKVMDASEAMKELKKRLEADGISLEDHFIKYSKFGYNYLSAKGKVKWLVPSYSFIIHPKEGVTDFGRVYTFPASHDAIAQQLFDEDVNSEVARKATQIDEESARLTPKE